MAVSNVVSAVIRLGDGIAVAFDFDIEAVDAASIKVGYIVGVTVVAAAPADYSVIMNGALTGGTVTFLVPPAAATKIYIYRETDQTQAVSVSRQQSYNPAVVERVWDKLTLLIQELSTAVKRSVKTGPDANPDQLVSTLESARDNALAAAAAASASAGQAALFDGPWVADAAALVANTSLTYTTGTSSSVATGAIVRTRAEGFAYEVAASGATDHHIATAGGVKLYSLSADIRSFNVKGDGVTNDAAAIQKATSLGRALIYPKPPVNYLGEVTAQNLFGTQYRNALSQRWMMGTSETPTNDPLPVIWSQKAINTNFADHVWDQGAAYFGILKQSGTSFVSALTANARQNGGSGDVIGVHGRSSAYASGGRVYGGWFYAHVDAGVTPLAAHALEVNGYNAGVDLGYGGDSQMMRLCMSDSSDNLNRFSAAIVIGRNTHGGDNNGVYTGITFQAGAIIRSAGEAANNEAIRVNAPLTADGHIGGLRFARQDAAHTGVFKYGLRTDEATFAFSNALWLGVGQRIRWGEFNTGLALNANTRFDFEGGPINIVNVTAEGALRVGNVQILTTRRQGWQAPTGATDKTTFNTASVTTAQLATRVKALIDDLTSHGIIGA